MSILSLEQEKKNFKKKIVEKNVDQIFQGSRNIKKKRNLIIIHTTLYI